MATLCDARLVRATAYPARLRPIGRLELLQEAAFGLPLGVVPSPRQPHDDTQLEVVAAAAAAAAAASCAVHQ